MSPANETGKAVVLELIGPAGVGKTTVARVLGQRERTVCATIWDTPESHLAVDTIRALPTLASLTLRSRAVPWPEFKHVVRVADLCRRLPRVSHTCDLVVLAEGPVYTATWLLVSGHPRIRAGRLRTWWSRSLLDWSSGLDAVVVLDAPDAILAERMRSRAKPHEVKHQTDEAIAGFLDRFREGFDLVLAELVAERGTRVLRMTADRDPRCLADDVVHCVMGIAHAD